MILRLVISVSSDDHDVSQLDPGTFAREMVYLYSLEAGPAALDVTVLSAERNEGLTDSRNHGLMKS